MHEKINGLQVRSRSLTQLDALGSKMLDTREHHLGGGPSQQQSHHLHHHYQPQQLQHPQNVESNPRFLAPTAASAEGSRQNRRHKLSRSQVGIIFFRLNVCVCIRHVVTRLKIFMQIQPHNWNKRERILNIIVYTPF